MKPLQFNMSRFKKVAGDKNSTTLEHDDGHQLKVAHSKLSPEMRKQFMALEMKDKTPVKLAKGGEVKAEEVKDAPVESAPMTQPNNFTDGQPMGISAPTGAPQAIYDGSDAARGAPMQAGPQGAPGDSGSASQAPSPQALQAAKDSLPQPEPGPIPNANVPSPMDASAPQVATAPQAAPQMIGPPRDTRSLIQQGYDSQVQGMKDEAKAKGDLGNAQAAAYERSAGAQAGNMKSFQDHTATLMQERQHLMSDIANQHIDPKQYMNSLGSEGRTNVAIGLILGGMGGGGTTNLAADFLNKQIDRDIEAQKSELGKKENLLTASFHHFGDMKSAADFTRVALMDQMQAKLGAALGRAASPMAKAELEKQMGNLQMQSGMYMTKIAARQTLEGGSDPQSMDNAMSQLRATDPAAAKEFEGRYVPNVGMAKVPVPEAVRSDIVTRQNFDTAIQNMRAFAQKHEGTVMDRAVVNEGKALASIFQNSARAASNGGVFKKSEAEFLNSFTPGDPTAFMASIRTNPQLKALAETNTAELNGIKRGVGLPVQATIDSRKLGR